MNKLAKEIELDFSLPDFHNKNIKKTLKPSSIIILRSTYCTLTEGNFFFIQMLTTQNSFKAEHFLSMDKVMCKVLEDDCRLPQEESSEKESDSILVFVRKGL